MFKKIVLISGTVVSGIATANMTDSIKAKIRSFGQRTEQTAENINERAKEGVVEAGKKVGETAGKVAGPVAGRYYGGKKAKEGYEAVEEKVGNAAQKVKETGKKAAKKVKDFFGYSQDQKPSKTSFMTSGVKGMLNSLFTALKEKGVIGKEITVEQLSEMDFEQFLIKVTASPYASLLTSTLISYMEQAPNMLKELAETLNNIQEQAEAKRKDYQLTSEQRKVLQQLSQAIENLRTAFCEHTEDNQ